MASRSASSLTNTTPRTCLCSPTTHPGSFRCSTHKKKPQPRVPRPNVPRNPSSSLKVFLLRVIKPSSHDLQRRKNFQPKPTRFCLMNGNRDAVTVSWSLFSSLVSLMFTTEYLVPCHFFCFSILNPFSGVRNIVCEYTCKYKILKCSVMIITIKIHYFDQKFLVEKIE